MDDAYLQHYGVLGMKWGIRRYQPYPEGKEGRYVGERTTKQKNISDMDTWKDKQMARIDKMYDKSYRKLERAEKQNPDDKSIAAYRTELEKQHAKDLTEIKKMSYVDVENAKTQEKEESKAKQQAAMKRAGDALLWSAKMTLIGARLGGTIAVFTTLANAGSNLFAYLGSEEGMAAMRAGSKVITKIGNGELTLGKLAQDFFTKNAPDSAAASVLGSIDFDAMLPNDAAISKVSGKMESTALSAVDRAIYDNVDDVIKTARKKVRI